MKTIKETNINKTTIGITPAYFVQLMLKYTREMLEEDPFWCRQLLEKLDEVNKEVDSLRGEIKILMKECHDIDIDNEDKNVTKST